MIRRGRLVGVEGLVGVVLGAALCYGGLALVNELHGWHEVDSWRRALDARRHGDVAGLMRSTVAEARAALAEGAPLALSADLAGGVEPDLYRHHMEYAYRLLRAGRIAEYNRLRQESGYLLFDLSGRDLSGLDLHGAILADTMLEGTDFSGARLEEADLTRADLKRAELGGADLTRARFNEANLSDARLTAVRGTGADFTEAVLASALLVRITELDGARFVRATLTDANLGQSRLPGCDLTGADLAGASLVETDLSEVAAMAGANLYGANLAGAGFRPEVTPRAWLVNATGAAPAALRALAAHGGIVRAEDVESRVDLRIVEGFRAQVAADPAIAPAQRRGVLLEMLRRFYCDAT